MNHEFEDNRSIFAGLSDKAIERINEIRREKKLSLQKIADHLDVSVSTVNRYIGENHDHNMTVVFLLGVADVLGVEVTEFFRDGKTSSTLKDSVQPFKRRISKNPDMELGFFFQCLADSFK